MTDPDVTLLRRWADEDFPLPVADAVYRILARLERAEEAYTDDAGTVWTPPTAWAYAQACKALHACRERAESAAVPREPTEAMIAIGARTIDEETVRDPHMPTVAARAWRAMYAAAPDSAAGQIHPYTEGCCALPDKHPIHWEQRARARTAPDRAATELETANAQLFAHGEKLFQRAECLDNALDVIARHAANLTPAHRKTLRHALRTSNPAQADASAALALNAGERTT